MILANGFLRTICVLTVLLTSSFSAAAETAAEFYKGKVVKLVVGFGAGGGYDTYARMLAPHLEQHLDATIVVENRPGGGGILALNQVSAAKPDGLTIMIISAATSAFSQITQAEGVRFDLNRLGFLGRVIDDKRVLVLGSASPYRTIEDILNSPRAVLFGGTSRTASSAAASAFISEALDLNAKMVVGYKSSKEIALATLRGEVDGFTISESSARRYVRDEGMFAAAVVSREPSALHPGVPTIFELTTLSPEQEWWLDYCDALFSLGRALVTTPDIPAERLEFLQQAVRDVLTDEKVIAEAQAKKNPLNYAAPTEAGPMVDRVIGGLTVEELATVRRVTQDKYN